MNPPSDHRSPVRLGLIFLLSLIVAALISFTVRHSFGTPEPEPNDKLTNVHGDPSKDEASSAGQKKPKPSIPAPAVPSPPTVNPPVNPLPVNPPGTPTARPDQDLISVRLLHGGNDLQVSPGSPILLGSGAQFQLLITSQVRGVLSLGSVDTSGPKEENIKWDDGFEMVPNIPVGTNWRIRNENGGETIWLKFSPFNSEEPVMFPVKIKYE